MMYIRSATIFLHRTFNPNQITLQTPPFEVTRTGWGTFSVKGVITFTDSSTMNFKHKLSFKPGGAHNTYVAFVTPHCGNVSPQPVNLTNMSPQIISPPIHNSPQPVNLTNMSPQIISPPIHNSPQPVNLTNMSPQIISPPIHNSPQPVNHMSPKNYGAPDEQPIYTRPREKNRRRDAMETDEKKKPRPRGQGRKREIQAELAKAQEEIARLRIELDREKRKKRLKGCSNPSWK